MASNVTGNGFEDPHNQGWTPQLNGRGTMDIISSCALTVILCCWTSVCPNIPALSDSRWDQFRDKFHLFCLGIAGPEFVLGLAAGQLSSARSSVQKFHSSGYTNWTMTHAFYADMGGFLLQTPNWPAFPLDAEQLYYLVTKGYVKYPSLEKANIDDRNKADGFARLITVCQALWFTVNCIGRPIQGLALTTLELTTASFIPIMLATSFFWRHKPLDVSRPVILETETTIAQILIEAADAQSPYRHTPLDFISREEWVLSLIWAYYVQLLRKLRIPLFSRPVRTRPFNRIPSDNWPNTELIVELFSGVAILAFSATFSLGWNFSFPSPAERILWRAASVYSLVFAVVGGTWTWYCKSGVLQQRKESSLATTQTKNPRVRQHEWFGSRAQDFGARLRNVSPDHDPHLEVPLRVLVTYTALCALYCLFRGYILVDS